MEQLGDYITIKTGRMDANAADPNGIYPFFTCAKELSRIDNWAFDCECVLVAGNCNPHVSYYKGKFNAYQRVYVIQSRDKGSLNIKYLYYFLKKYMTLVLDRQRGAIEKFFCLDDFTGIKIALPDLPTQLRIAGVLRSIDEKIELNRKKIAELEALAKTIYDYWFVQFDFPDKNGKPYKSSGGKMVWNEQLKREVPEGWEVMPLPQIAYYLFGNPFDSSLFNANGEGFPIVRIRNVKDGHTSDFTTETAPNEYIIENGDFIIGMDGYFDMNHWIGGNAYLVQRSCRISAKDDLYASWLSLSLVAPIKYLEKSLTGATLAHLGKAHLDKIVLPLPPQSMSNALSLLNNIVKQKVHLGVANLEFKRQRDTLLPLLMNGQVSAGDLK